MSRSGFCLLLFITKITFCSSFIQERSIDYDTLSYSVGLSEPLQSTLEWDYDGDDDTKLIFRWNITLKNNLCGILAFSTHDLNTNNLDVIIFGKDKKIYNAYTNDDSGLYLPKRSVKLSFTILNSLNIKNDRTEYSIGFIRPLDTCAKDERSYVIDSGTTHLLTGSMVHDDFDKLKQGKSIKMDVERMNLVLQRVQLLKSRVSLIYV